jgi:ferredoxin
MPGDLGGELGVGAGRQRLGEESDERLTAQSGQGMPGQSVIMRSGFCPGAAAEAATVTGTLEARQTEKLHATFRLRLVLRRRQVLQADLPVSRLSGVIDSLCGAPASAPHPLALGGAAQRLELFSRTSVALCAQEWRRLQGPQLALPAEAGMRVVVDLSRCEGYAQCAFLAPEAFRMHGEEALMYDPNPADARREQVLRAAAACPVQAILVDQLEGRGAPVEASSP